MVHKGAGIVSTNSQLRYTVHHNKSHKKQNPSSSKTPSTKIKQKNTSSPNISQNNIQTADRTQLLKQTSRQ